MKQSSQEFMLPASSFRHSCHEYSPASFVLASKRGFGKKKIEEKVNGFLRVCIAQRTATRL